MDGWLGSLVGSAELAHASHVHVRDIAGNARQMSSPVERAPEADRPFDARVGLIVGPTAVVDQRHSADAVRAYACTLPKHDAVDGAADGVHRDYLIAADRAQIQRLSAGSTTIGPCNACLHGGLGLLAQTFPSQTGVDLHRLWDLIKIIQH